MNNQEKEQEELKSLEELETACIGAALLSKHALMVFIENVIPEYFYTNGCRLVADTIFYMFEKKEDIDIITLRTNLKERGRFKLADKLTDFYDVDISSSNVKTYVSKVKEEYKRRELKKTLSDSYQDAQNKGNEVDDIIQKMSSKISIFDEDKTKIVKIGQNMNYADLACEGDSIKTGFNKIDQYLHGLFRKELIILAARPSLGKTTLAVNIAQNIAKAKNVLMYSLEMSWQSIAIRMLASETDMTYMKIKIGSVTGIEKEKLEKAGEALGHSNFWVNDRAGISIEQLVRSAMTFKFNKGLDLIVVDYLQLMAGSVKGNRNEALGDITRSLKILAKDLDVPVLLLSQLSREVERREGQIPRLSDLRDSGEIEQNADVVMFIYEDDGASTIQVAKNRNGRLGSFRMILEKQFFRFQDL